MIGRSKDGKPVLAADLIGREDVMSILYDIEEKLSETEYILNNGKKESKEWQEAAKYVTRDFSAYTFLTEKHAALFGCLKAASENMSEAELADFWFSIPEEEAGVEIPLSFEQKKERKTLPFHTINLNGRWGQSMTPQPVIQTVEAKGARLFVQTVLFFILEEERVLRDVEKLDSALSFEFFKKLMQIENRRGTGKGVPAGVLLNAMTKVNSSATGVFDWVQGNNKTTDGGKKKRGAYENVYRANFIEGYDNYYLQDYENNMETDPLLRGKIKRFAFQDISLPRFGGNKTRDTMHELEWRESAHGPEYLTMLSLIKGSVTIRRPEIAEDQVDWHEQDYVPAVMDLLEHFAYGKIWRRLLNMRQAAELCRSTAIARSSYCDDKTDYAFYDPYLYERVGNGARYDKSLRRFAAHSFYQKDAVTDADVSAVESELFAASGLKNRYAFIPPELGMPKNTDALVLYRGGVSKYFSDIGNLYKTEGNKSKASYKNELKSYRYMLSVLMRWIHKAVRKKEADEGYQVTDKRGMADKAYIEGIAQIVQPHIRDIGAALLHSGKGQYTTEGAYLKVRLFLSGIRSLSPGVFEELCRCLKLEEVFGQDKRSGARDAISAYFNANRENEESFCHLFSTSALVVGGLKNKRLKREMEEKAVEELAKLLTKKLSDSDGTPPEYGEVEKWLEEKGELFLMGMDKTSLRLWRENPHKFWGSGDRYFKSLEEKMESSWRQLAAKTDIMDFDEGCGQPFL